MPSPKGINRKKMQGFELSFPGLFLRIYAEIVSLSYLPTPPLEQDMTQGQFLSGV